MRRSIPTLLASLLIAAACTAGLVSCEPAVRAADGNTAANTNTNANTNSNYIGTSNSGLVAATVDGTPIYEDTITADIAQLREEEGLTTTYEWAQWLGENGYTTSTIRDAAIDNYVDVEAIKKAAAEYGVTADEEAVDNLMNKMKGLYTDQNAWNTALANAGYTEETKREEFLEASLEQNLMDKVTPAESVDEQQSLFTEWIDNYKTTMNVVIYEMPSGLPYAV